MTVLDLAANDLSARVCTSGGLLLGFWMNAEGRRIPLLREAVDDGRDPLASACYPLVPFGNRVKDNQFTFNGRQQHLRPNTDRDRHYLHGDGWRGEWNIRHVGEAIVELGFDHAAGKLSPYAYSAVQGFSLDKGMLEMTLSVTNRGNEALPFGLGWHPYFPMTAETTLLAPAGGFWTEAEDWLPGEPADIPAELDFGTARKLPNRWVNNGFQDWCGRAEITWPERDAKLTITADAVFRHAFIFVSDASFDPAFKRDYFCFEPMSHLANGHNLPDLGGLVVLQPGETLAGSMRLEPEYLG